MTLNSLFRTLVFSAEKSRQRSSSHIFHFQRMSVVTNDSSACFDGVQRVQPNRNEAIRSTAHGRGTEAKLTKLANLIKPVRVLIIE